MEAAVSTKKDGVGKLAELEEDSNEKRGNEGKN